MVFKRKIYASECATDPKLALQNVYLIIQDAVTSMLEEMHCDNVTLMSKYKIMMVFTKHRAKVFKRPEWNKEVTIVSRVAKLNKLLCYIKTEVFDENGNLLIDSVIESCCLDMNTFKISPLTNLPLISENEDIDTKFNFLGIEAELQKIKTFKVIPTLCDMLGHLNNAKAIFPLADSFETKDFDEIFSHQFELAVKYNSQAMMGSCLELNLAKNDDGYFFSYTKEDGSLAEQGYIKFLD